MKGHEVDAAAKRGMNDAAQLEHDQWRSKTTDQSMKEGGVWGSDDDLSWEVRRGQDDGRESVKGAFMMFIISRSTLC